MFLKERSTSRTCWKLIFKMGTIAALMASTTLNLSRAWNRGSTCSSICNAVGNPSSSPSRIHATSKSEPCIAYPLQRLPNGLTLHPEPSSPTKVCNSRKQDRATWKSSFVIITSCSRADNNSSKRWDIGGASIIEFSIIPIDIIGAGYFHCSEYIPATPNLR